MIKPLVPDKRSILAGFISMMMFFIAGYEKGKEIIKGLSELFKPYGTTIEI